ncbi:MAG: HAD-IIB family hydrolase [Patescibacteria group bacterium]
MEVTIKKYSKKNDNKSLKILKEIKKCLKVLVVDYDGTIFDTETSKFNHQRATNLLIRAMEKGITPAIISARDVSFFQFVFPLLNSSLSKLNNKNDYYFAGGNGSYLFKINCFKKELIYNYSLNQNEIKNILQVYKKILKQMNLSNDDLIEDGIDIFSSLLNKLKGQRSISAKLLNLSKKYRGAVFVETSKISIVLPVDNKKKNLFQNYLINYLPRKFSINGDHTFIHVSKKIKINKQLIDGKLHAVNTIIKYLGLSKKQLAVFGDSPMGNDQAMLNFLPYSFTNNKNFTQLDNLPPYFLLNIGLPVEKVHKAIQFLIEDK